MSIARLSVSELVACAAAGAAHETMSAALGRPIVVVTGEGASAADIDAAVVASRTLPCVLAANIAGAAIAADPADPADPAEPADLANIAAIADSRLAPLVDVFATDRALESIMATVGKAPIASVSLALLLRGGASQSIEEGLVAESTTYSMLQAGPEFAAWRDGYSRREPRPTDGADAVLVERQATTLTVTLNRPRVHNALDVSLRDGLTNALTIAVVDPSIERVIVRGNGPSFCSGGDLATFATFDDPASAHLVRLTRSPARLFASLAARLEVHLHGACLGAGIELAAFAGRVIADESASIGLPEVPLGLVPGAGGTVSLPRRIGRHRTALLALSGLRVDAPTALAWGLVDEVRTRAGA